MPTITEVSSSGSNERSFDARKSSNDFERMRQEALASGDAAKSRQANYQAIAKYNSSGAQQNKAQGTQLQMTGQVKIAGGFIQIMMGGAMLAKGMAMNAVPGAGTPFIIEGTSFIAKGGTDVMFGGQDVQSGKRLLQIAQEQLQLAVDNNILDKSMGAVVLKAMNLARTMEFKKEMMEQLAEVLKPMLEKAGFNTQEMNEDQLMKFMDTFSESAGKALANGGVMEIDLEGSDKEAKFLDANGDELSGTFNFIRDEETGEFYQVELAYDEEGNVQKDVFGNPLLDPTKDVKKVEEGDLKDYLEIKFLFVDKFKLLAKELSYASFDSSENLQLVPYDVNNPEHMREFADLINKTNFQAIKSGAMEAPRKFGVDDDGQYFQAWDWTNNLPVGPKTYMSEIYGETDEMRSNIDNFQLALDRSNNALNNLGLQPGGGYFNTLSSSSDTSLTPKKSNDRYGLGDIASREGQAYADFRSVTVTRDLLNAQNNILQSPSLDNVGEGFA